MPTGMDQLYSFQRIDHELRKKWETFYLARGVGRFRSSDLARKKASRGIQL